jgi:hypothetical protein
MLARPSALIREKTMSILSHINKRLKMLPNMSLPVQAIVDLFLSAPLPSSSTTAVDGPDPNLMTQCCLMYIDKGFSRMPSSERVLLSPLLLRGIASRPPSQQRILLHMFLSVLSLPRHVEDALNALPPPEPKAMVSDEKDTSAASLVTSPRPLPMDDDDDDIKRPIADTPEAKAAAAAVTAAAEAKAAEKKVRDEIALSRFAWANDTRDRTLVLQWLMDVLLFSPNMLVPWAAKQAIEAKEKAAAAASSSGMPGTGRSLVGAPSKASPAVAGKKEEELKVMVIPAGMSQEALDRITEGNYLFVINLMVTQSSNVVLR